MKILFFGTSGYAVPALRKLHESGFETAAVVTQPDKPAGRKKLLLPSPVKVWALEHGLKVLQPPHLTSPTRGEEYSLFSSLPLVGRAGEGVINLFIVASYGKIIPKAVLDIPKYGALNIHPSLLPKYRGPSPIQSVILNGDEETGVTIIKMDEEVDHGDIVAQSEKRKVQNKNFRVLHDELAQLGADLLINILPDYLADEIKLVPQDHSQATFTKIITKDDARIDWTKSAEQIDRLVRAYSQWPVAWSMLDGKRLKIFEAFLPLPQGRGRERGGKVGEVEVQQDRILVQTGAGLLELLDLQLEGATRMSAKDFLRGHPSLTGKTLN